MPTRQHLSLVHAIPRPLRDQDRELIRAAERGDARSIRALVATGANLMACDPASYGANAPLVAACTHGHLAAAKDLADLGADVRGNAHDATLDAPLRIASSHGHATIVTMLCERGANVHAADAEGPEAPLAAAIAGHHASTVTVLLAYGAHVHAQRHGIRLLELIGRSHAIPLVLATLDHGIAPHDDGHALLHGALDSGDQAMINALMGRANPTLVITWLNSASGGSDPHTTSAQAKDWLERLFPTQGCQQSLI